MLFYSKQRSDMSFIEKYFTPSGLSSSPFFPFNIPFMGFVVFVVLSTINTYLNPPQIGDIDCRDGIVFQYQNTPENDKKFVPQMLQNGTYQRCQNEVRINTSKRF